MIWFWLCLLCFCRCGGCRSKMWPYTSSKINSRRYGNQEWNSYLRYGFISSLWRWFEFSLWSDFIEASENTQVDSSNVCVFVDGQLDRSPTRFGVSAWLAIYHVPVGFIENRLITIESTLGMQFKYQVKGLAKFFKYDAVIPIVKGHSFCCGRMIFGRILRILSLLVSN